MSNIYTRVIPAVTQTVQAFRYTEVGVIPGGLQEACQDRMILSTRGDNGRPLKTPRLWFWAECEDDVTVNIGDWITVEQIPWFTSTAKGAQPGGYEPDIDCWTDTAFRDAFGVAEDS